MRPKNEARIRSIFSKEYFRWNFHTWKFSAALQGAYMSRFRKGFEDIKRNWPHFSRTVRRKNPYFWTESVHFNFAEIRQEQSKLLYDPAWIDCAHTFTRTNYSRVDILFSCTAHQNPDGDGSGTPCARGGDHLLNHSVRNFHHMVLHRNRYAPPSRRPVTVATAELQPHVWCYQRYQMEVSLLNLVTFHSSMIFRLIDLQYDVVR